MTSPAIFVRVVEDGSIRAAARSLGIPKSSVSRRIAELEAQLGVRLLQRTTRKLSLTDAGTTYFRGAGAAVSALEDAEREVRALQAAPRGLLRVTAPSNFGTQFLTPIVLRFMRAYPDVQVSLQLTDRMVDLVEESVDVAIRAGALPDSSLTGPRLGGTTFVAVASPSYLATHGRPRKPEDLAEHTCLIHGESHRASWRFRRGRKAVDVRVRGDLACTSFYPLHDAAIAGLGVARVPALLAVEGLTNGTLVRLLERFEPPDAPLHVLYPSHRHLAPKVRAFVDTLVAAFETPPWEVRLPKKRV